MNSQLGKLAHVRAYDVMAGYKVGERWSGSDRARVQALRFEKKCVWT